MDGVGEVGWCGLIGGVGFVSRERGPKLLKRGAGRPCVVLVAGKVSHDGGVARWGVE